MVPLLLSQVNKVNFALLIFNSLVIYNLYKLVQQTHLTFFLGYMLLLLLYIGVVLIYYNLDILALILWIVYGSFITIIFIFSFMWINIILVNKPENATKNINTFFFFSLLIFVTFNYFSNNVWQWYYFISCFWVDYYELLVLQNTIELEALGNALGYENICGLLAIANLLTLACITASSIVITAKKNKWFSSGLILKLTKKFLYKFSTLVRTQYFYQQEQLHLFRANQISLNFHRRRT